MNTTQQPTKDNHPHDSLHEMAAIQAELRQALSDLLVEVGGKLKPEERVELEAEFHQIDEVLERLKTGFVYVALFGKTSVGKSAIVNALLGEDVAKVGIEMDCNSEAHAFQHSPWMIVDVPGMMGRDEFEALAVTEAKKAHGIIFCVDGEPYGPELDLFNLVHDATASVPKIVFVNKWDEWEHRPKVNQEKVKGLIESKMAKFVRHPADIVYGSAQRLDLAKDAYVRQSLPQLLDRMYEGAGSLGIVMNVIDPARRAEHFGDLMRDKIMEVRIRLARKVISSFAAGAVVGSFIPFTDLVVAPGILSSMVYALFTILGYNIKKEQAGAITLELIKACVQALAVDFGASMAIDVAVTASFILGPLGALIAMGALGAQAYLKYKRTVILGEVTIEYIKNDCSSGGEDRADVIRRCKERAIAHYMHLRKASD